MHFSITFVHLFFLRLFLLFFISASTRCIWYACWSITQSCVSHVVAIRTHLRAHTDERSLTHICTDDGGPKSGETVILLYIMWLSRRRQACGIGTSTILAWNQPWNIKDFFSLCWRRLLRLCMRESGRRNCGTGERVVPATGGEVSVRRLCTTGKCENMYSPLSTILVFCFCAHVCRWNDHAIDAIVL